MIATKNFLAHLLVLLSIAGATTLAYQNAFEVPFVFDDQHVIEKNQKIREPGSFLDLDALTEQRPLADLSFSLNYHFHGLSVFGYHLVNVAIHVLASWVVYFLALSIYRVLAGPAASPAPMPQPLLPAAFAASVFALHPVQTQAVTYIAQRYTSLAALFYMGAVLAYIMARKGMRAAEAGGCRGMRIAGGCCPYWTLALFLLCLVCGLASFLSKQVALSLPLAILLVEYMLFDRTRAGWTKKMVTLLPLLGLFVLFVLYSAGVLQGDISLVNLLETVDERSRETLQVTRWQYLLTQCKVICIYLGLLLWPVDQSLDHMYPFVTNFYQSWTIWGALLLVALGWSAFLLRKRQPVLSLGIGWFFVALSVESSLIPIRDALVEHRLYLPLFGFALILGWGVWMAGARWRIPVLLLALCVMCALAWASFQRNQVWQSPKALWAESVAQNPRNYRAHYNLGLELARQGEIREALAHFHKAVRIWPEYAKAHHNLGLAYQKTKDIKLAQKHYRLAVEHNPGHIKARLSLSSLLIRQGEHGAARKHLEEILRSEPKNAKALLNLAVIDYVQGKIGQALTRVNQVLRIDPQSFEAHLNKGVMLLRQGRLEKAAVHLQQAKAIRPQDPRPKGYLRRLQGLR